METTAVPSSSPTSSSSTVDYKDDTKCNNNNDQSSNNNKDDPQSWNSNDNDTVTTANNTTKERSALQDNIARKGKNAYYFAHAHKATGPKWDGKVEPRLLSSCVGDTNGDGVSSNGSTSTTTLPKSSSSSFEYYKSNITAYSFLDDGPVVKIYLTGLTDIGEKCTYDNDIVLNFTDRSFCITIHNFNTSTINNEPLVLSFGRLCGSISDATYRIKKDKVIITLTKQDLKDWHTINDKGSPNHEVV